MIKFAFGWMRLEIENISITKEEECKELQIIGAMK
jgi:hypothetical protein